MHDFLHNCGTVDKYANILILISPLTHRLATQFSGFSVFSSAAEPAAVCSACWEVVAVDNGGRMLTR